MNNWLAKTYEHSKFLRLGDSSQITAMTQRLTIASSTNYLNKEFSVTAAAPLP